MHKYIDLDAAIARLTHLEVTKPTATMTDAKRALADMFPGNVISVVNCKDCRYRGMIFCPMVRETLDNGLVDYAVDEGYCYIGAEKDGVDNAVN